MVFNNFMVKTHGFRLRFSQQNQSNDQCIGKEKGTDGDFLFDPI